MNNVNEIIFGFIGKPTSPKSNITSTHHGYDAFVHTSNAAIYTLMSSLSMWGGQTKIYEKDGLIYRYFELNCADKEFFMSDIFKRICKPYDIKITICEDSETLYETFHKYAKRL